MLVDAAPAARETWRHVAARDPEGLVSQTPEWVDVLCRAGYEDATRSYRGVDGSRMVLPLVRRRGLPRALAPLASLPTAWGVGGLLAERRPEVGELAAILADLRAQLAVRVLVRPNPLHARAWAKAARGLPLVVLPWRAHVLDLRSGERAVWTRRFATGARRAVLDAERDGLEVRVGAGADLLGDFRRLYEESVRRQAALRQEPQALALLRAYRRDPPAKFVHVAAALPEGLRVCIAYRGDVPLAGLILLLGANATCARGVLDPDRAGAAGVGELLHWRAVQAACAAGCAAYHLGESGGSARLASFKERLGARPLPSAAYCLERLPLHRPGTVARAAAKRAIGVRDVA